ncbi:MAG: SEC-C metal-binding domain-containing protein [Clostridia bacterium]|nr:SEC-C metal-binding domain-containing protein [Clostridia bacterium]
MKLYEAWQQRAQMFTDEQQRLDYWNAYFALETEQYEKILAEKTWSYKGTVEALAKEFNMDETTFAGFIDGINTSLEKEVDLDSLEETSEVELNIKPEELYLNMLRAKAPWLYELEGWNDILTAERRHELTKQYRAENVFVNETVVGRNDPCPCGSGKKYKKCCGKNA